MVGLRAKGLFAERRAETNQVWQDWFGPITYSQGERTTNHIHRDLSRGRHTFTGLTSSLLRFLLLRLAGSAVVGKGSFIFMGAVRNCAQSKNIDNILNNTDTSGARPWEATSIPKVSPCNCATAPYPRLMQHILGAFVASPPMFIARQLPSSFTLSAMPHFLHPFLSIHSTASLLLHHNPILPLPCSSAFRRTVPPIDAPHAAYTTPSRSPMLLYIIMSSF